VDYFDCFFPETDFIAIEQLNVGGFDSAANRRPVLAGQSQPTCRRAVIGMGMRLGHEG
jgi:hypothetical protein